MAVCRPGPPLWEAVVTFNDIVEIFASTIYKDALGAGLIIRGTGLASGLNTYSRRIGVSPMPDTTGIHFDAWRCEEFGDTPFIEKGL
jgi:hypothetical protein